VDADGLRLGIDFGTSNTVAVARWPDGRVRPLLFDGAPLLPSAVILDERGALTAGREALHAARVRPEYFEPNPKRRIDDGTVLLGEAEVPVRDLIAATLRRVVDEADRVLGARPEAVLTHPASWGARRCQVLRDAAQQAGLAAPTLVAEPVAAGTYFVRVHGARLPVGSVAVVYDLGAGTFDASVLRRTAAGFDVLACEGLPDAGGLDIDAALVAFLGAVYGSRNGALWRRLERPATTTDRRARRLLWDDVRGAKEALSRTSSSTIVIPLLDEDAPLGREQLEQLARPILDRSVAATASALRDGGVRPAELACVFLVGGASRIPLAATLLHTAFGVAPTVIEQPEMVVAEGSLHVSAGASAMDAGTDATPAPFWATGVVVAPVSPPVGPVSGPPFSSQPVSSQPFSAPPVSASPFSLPPVSAPPVSAPPVSAPPVSVPPVSAPDGPVSAPPGTVSPGLSPSGAVSAGPQPYGPVSAGLPPAAPMSGGPAPSGPFPPDPAVTVPSAPPASAPFPPPGAPFSAPPAMPGSPVSARAQVPPPAVSPPTAHASQPAGAPAAHPGSAHPGSAHPGSAHPGSAHPGSAHPGSAPPGSAASATGQYGWIVAVAGSLLAVLIILAVEGAADAFEIGFDTAFGYPSALLLIAQILLVAALAVRGHLVDPPGDPIGSAGRFVGLVVLGHGIGMGIGLSRYAGDWYEEELALAMVGGIGLAIGGVATVVGVLVDRSRPAGGWHRYGVPLVLGLGSGLAGLVDQAESGNVAFYEIFSSSDSPALDLSRYLGFTVGLLGLPILAVVAAALIGRTPAVRGAGSALRRTASALAAMALTIAGVAIAAAAAESLS
jgi:hypothetical protein